MTWKKNSFVALSLSIAMVGISSGAWATLAADGLCSGEAGDPCTAATDIEAVQTSKECVMNINAKATDLVANSKWVDQKCQAAVTNLKGAISKCAASAQTAAKGCIEMLSQPIQDAMPLIGGGISAVSAMSSIADACKKQSEIMDIAKTAMAAYNTICGGAKLLCENSCSSVDTAIGNVKAACAVPTGPVDIMDGTPVVMANINREALAIAPASKACFASCSKYGANLIAGGIGLLQLAQSGKSAAQCNKATTDATTASAAVDCTQTANANNLTCVCLKNPSASGCSTAANGVTPITAVTASGLPAGAGGNMGDPGLIAPTTAANPSLGSSSSGGAGNAGVGGGPSLGVGGSASGAKAPAAAAREANNYGGGGDSGGGSGSSKGGGWADGSSGTGRAAAKAALNARAPASDISGKAGKSNWDKISNTYLQMSSNLMK